jgi:hypothetical protein
MVGASIRGGAGLRAPGATLGKAPAPNGGIAKPHGGDAHNKAIDREIKILKSDPGVTNVRKNQQQADINGNKVGTNKPDIQYDQKKCHHCVEIDNSALNSTRHGQVIRANDPAARVDLRRLP